ncbi:photosystem I core protein PsaA, partial [Nodularia spumigena CS-587/03]|nr:photosystem I core protein PsaA [Nodularia spumigena CS-587/03]
MTISPPEREEKKARVIVDKDPVPTSFEKWAKPGHFDRSLAKGPKTTTWIWNLHALAHDFDTHTSDLEDISRKIFAAHFGHLSVVAIWLSGMLFHGAKFSNYEAWLSDPLNVSPSAQVVWPIVGQDILNGDVGGGFRGIQITSGLFQVWRGWGITSSFQLYVTAIGGLVLAGLFLFAGWFHYHKRAPKLEWFQNVESMLNHHLAVLLGCGSLGWTGHLIHVSAPINKLLDAGVAAKDIPLPHEFILNKDLLTDLYPSFASGLTPFFTLNWGQYADFLTFKGGLNPVTGGLWMTDIAHHHLAIAVLFIIAGHMYRTNWGIGHSIKEILENHKGPFTGEGHKGLYENLTTSWHAQLATNLAFLGSLTIIIAHHMYAMPPYPYLATDYATQLCIFTHHMWIGGFLIVGGAAHAAIFMVRDYDPVVNQNNVLDRVIRHRDAIISHLNWVCIFLGFHSFGLYIHNDTMRALGRPQDMFSDSAIQLQPVFAQWVQNLHTLAPGGTAPNAIEPVSYAFGGGILAVGGKVAMMPIALGTADFLVHHIHAFT